MTQQEKNILDETSDLNNEVIDTQEERSIDVGQGDDVAQPTIQEVEDIDQLKKQLEEARMIAWKAQHDLLLLRYDFDSLMRRVEREQADQKINAQIDNLKKFLPLFDQIQKIVDALSDADRETPLAKWVVLVAANIVKMLEQLGVQKIVSIGEEVNPEYHEPIGSEPIEDDAMKNRIVKEYEAWYLWVSGDKRIVVKPAKVVVGI